MQAAIKAVSVFGLILAFPLFLLIWYGTEFEPDRYTATDLASLTTGTPFFRCSCDTPNEATAAGARQYRAQLKLFDAIPVKSATVEIVERDHVIPGGDAFGLRLFTDGVMITQISSVNGKAGAVIPAKKAGLRPGDVITEIDGVRVTSNAQLAQTVQSSKGQKMKVSFTRNGSQKSTAITPAAAADGAYRIGIWVRDSTAGVGTVTFTDPQSGVIAGLGHAICDSDAGEIMPVREGEMVRAEVRGCIKGTPGTPGELCGFFHNDVIGTVELNCEGGVYGLAAERPDTAGSLPVALINEVVTGKAQIIATVDKTGPQRFDIEITRFFRAASQEKNMIIRITDKRLLAITGGIVQGMSGSPILQNGRLVGAVTHVFVNDPQQGYAIFAQSMVRTARQLAQQISRNAA